MHTTDYLLLGISLTLFGGIALLGHTVLSAEWAVATMWIGLVVGVGGTIFDEFVSTSQ
ncbi:hypothetical protein [Haladaptatus sp. CMAA 1911]|uniref:hypothetical protein n=1 Tax=unclassified Haladaptatus TaxID=2622732 RepID=UPI003754BB26